MNKQALILRKMQFNYCDYHLPPSYEQTFVTLCSRNGVKTDRISSEYIQYKIFSVRKQKKIFKKVLTN